MRVVFFTFGMGSGDLVFGASLYFAFRRAGADIDFTALTNCEFSGIVEPFFEHVHVQPEPEKLLRTDHDTSLFYAIEGLSPDVLIVSGIWLPLYRILADLPGRKVFITRMAPEGWFHVPLPDGSIDFDPSAYDLAFTIEPGFSLPGAQAVEPMIVRNHDEVLRREDARDAFRVPVGKKLCVIAHNGYAGELETLIEAYGAPGSEYHVVTATNAAERDLFPLAEYASAIDLLIGGAGYNIFYETRYFEIESILCPFERNADDQAWRLATNSEYRFDENGADTIARRVLRM